MNGLSRRELMGAGLALAAMVPATAKADLRHAASAVSPTDQDYWREVAGQYDVTDEVIQLENGNWGIMARPVLEAYGRHLATVNRRNSFYSRRELVPDLMRIRARVAANLGCDPAEIAFTRGATESLLGLIGGYNRLRPGDTVLYADLDYDSMQSAMVWLKQRRGVEVATLALPQPATYQNVIDAYEQALAANPHTKLMLLTHVSHRTGLVLPVSEIIAIARSRGVDVIVDSAHAWGQLDFKLSDLNADFVGLTCQKWIGSPMGVGVMYIRRDRITDIDAPMGIESGPANDAFSRVHTGTSDYAAYLTVSEALDFHEKIGAAAKEVRLRHLRDRWAEPLRGFGKLEILTPSDPRLTCAITSFRLSGQTSLAENKALSRLLLERFNIFTVERDGVASGACVRVTPSVFTNESDVDKLVEALKALA
ncbi:aminotransferase class V-fold PLP-dependent enzyme [Telmatospirillum sp.]|uniref:aminotransferase class V-fold PLP-dependent enzyme n=1 Tax=Telmatospirillum sp. TaxID=2079197 RepID=UPI00283E38AE|nr:aminotransferase class V-fold PLP-dependent enzyme [Telmatospirillum sp.]MDR3441018.1 aminotransferase class V-fold PLP-dependent enzyme [Telmatospirillum sp.]